MCFAVDMCLFLDIPCLAEEEGGGGRRREEEEEEAVHLVERVT